MKMRILLVGCCEINTSLTSMTNFVLAGKLVQLLQEKTSSRSNVISGIDDRR